MTGVHIPPAPAKAPISWRRRLWRQWAWRWLVLKAMAWLTLITPLLHLLPFRIMAHLFIGRPGAAVGHDGVNAPLPTAVRHVGLAVARAADLVPFPCVCLPQAIVAKAMLMRRGYPALVHLSARLGTQSDSNAAHAWVTWQGRVVIGAGKPAEQVEIACFV